MKNFIAPFLNQYIIKMDPRFLAAFASLLLSLFIGIEFYINNDGIYYLKAAEDFLHNGVNASHHGLRWPFYPLLIASFSYITHLSLLHSALILQALLQIILIISFINIIRALGGNRTVQLLGALTLLLHPEFNGYRGIVIRDFGYWAFLFTGFYYLIRYWQQPSWSYMCGWFVSTVIAILFRIEGIVILGLAPLLGILIPSLLWRTRVLHIARLYAPWALLIIPLIIFLFLYQQNTISYNLDELGRLRELPQWWTFLSGEFVTKWENMQIMFANMAPRMHEDGIKIFLISGLIFYIFYQLCLTLHLLFLAILIYGQWQHCLDTYLGTLEKRLLYGFLAINFLIPIVFVSARWFLRGRFLMPTVIILLLVVSFSLAALYQRWQSSAYSLRYKRPAQLLLGLICVWLLVDSTISFNSPAVLVKESATWIQTHTASTASVYTNNQQLAFYANRPGMDLNIHPFPLSLMVLENNQWQQYDYLALYVKRKDIAAEKLISDTIPYPPVEHFINRRGYQVLIFKVKK